MTEKKKVVKFVEEKELNKQKKKWRSKDRLNKYEDKDDTKVIEDPPQKDNLEEDIAHFKRCRDPNDVLYQRQPTPPRAPSPRPEPRGWAPFTPLKLEDYTPMELDILEPSIHYKPRDGPGEGWESEDEPPIKWWNNKIIRDEYDLEDGWFD